MATYKKGFKKQNSETVLLKIIIGIIIGVFVFVGVAFIYDASTQWKNYDYFTTITEYDELLEYTNGEDDVLDNYIVYIYGNSCENCVEIKNDVLKDGNKINKDGEMFFIANVDTMTDSETNLENFLDDIDCPTDEYGTPMLVVVVDGEFYEYFIGASDVEEAVDSVRSGDYEPFNS